jgi:hypothetical protein
VIRERQSMPMARDQDRTARIIIVLYVCAFAVGTVSHVLDIARGGWLPYRQYALALNAFWTALTFLDPLAIAFLVYRRFAGVCLALFIISIDIVVNLTVGIGERIQSGHFTFWGLYSQVPVGLFMWATAPTLWRSGTRQVVSPVAYEQ